MHGLAVGWRHPLPRQASGSGRRPPVSLGEDRFCWRRPVSHREDGLCRWFVGLRRPAQQGRRLAPPSCLSRDGGARCAHAFLCWSPHRHHRHHRRPCFHAATSSWASWAKMPSMTNQFKTPQESPTHLDLAARQEIEKLKDMNI